MESMNSWSLRASSLRAAKLDCRWASALNSLDRTSGTQIWMGRNPWRRSRSRCALTLSLDDLDEPDSDMLELRWGTIPLGVVTCNLACHS